MVFAPYESFFVIFPNKDSDDLPIANTVNFPKINSIATLHGPWHVSFDPEWGGPENITFETLTDWTQNKERGIKYYSGIATYAKAFNFSKTINNRIYLDLGTVHDMAHVILNGKDLGVVWCAPWQVDVSGVIEAGKNKLEIEVANRWPNRMLGDQEFPDARTRSLKWENGLLEGKEFKTGRYTFSTYKGYNKLLPSGLSGLVRIMIQND
jgi:hypothetical protein